MTMKKTLKILARVAAMLIFGISGHAQNQIVGNLTVQQTATVNGALTARGNKWLSPVSTIAALKALSVTAPVALTTGTSVTVLGYSAAGDGGGGDFYYSSSSSATNNNGTIISPNAGSGRWLRIFKGGINVRWFGAVLDGTTNDGTAIQAAINAAQLLYGDATVAGGTTVVIDQAPNFGSSTITVGVTGAAGDDTDGKPIDLQLAYYGNATGSGNPVFELASRSRIKGINRRFTRITKTGAGPIIQITAPSEDCDITDLRLNGGGQAIKLKASVASGDVPAIRIRRIFAESQTGNAIEVCGMADGFIMEDVFTTTSGGAGLRVGIMDGNATGATNENSTVRDCFFQGAGTKAVWIECDTVSLQSSQQMISTVFDNVQLSAPANEGFYFRMLTPGGITLRNMTIFGSPTGAANTYAMFRFLGDYGGLAGVTIDAVSAPAASAWRYVLQVSGSGSYGANSLFRSYQNNGTSTAIFSLDANAGFRIEDVATTTGITNLSQPKIDGITGTTGGSAQPAGNVGEVKSVFVLAGAPVSLTTDTPANVASLALTAGNWLICPQVRLHGAASTTFSYYIAGINTTSATQPSGNSGQRADASDPTFQTVLTDKTVVVPSFTTSLSGSATVYLVATVGFAVSTANSYGSIIAVRLP